MEAGVTCTWDSGLPPKGTQGILVPVWAWLPMPQCRAASSLRPRSDACLLHANPQVHSDREEEGKDGSMRGREGERRDPFTYPRRDPQRNLELAGASGRDSMAGPPAAGQRDNWGALATQSSRVPHTMNGVQGRQKELPGLSGRKKGANSASGLMFIFVRGPRLLLSRTPRSPKFACLHFETDYKSSGEARETRTEGRRDEGRVPAAAGACRGGYRSECLPK